MPVREKSFVERCRDRHNEIDDDDDYDDMMMMMMWVSSRKTKAQAEVEKQREEAESTVYDSCCMPDVRINYNAAYSSSPLLSSCGLFAPADRLL